MPSLAAAIVSVCFLIQHVCPVLGQASCPDASALAPSEVQGDQFSSPLEGQTVTVTGIVTDIRDDDRLYIQSRPKAVDSNPATSEGVLVYSSAVDWQTFPDLAVNKLVVATGEVTEFRAGGSNTLATTEVVVSSAADVAVCSGCPGSGTCTAKPVRIKCGGSQKDGRSIPAETIYQGTLDLTSCGGSCPALEPGINALDFYESLDGNLVRITNALVTGINSFGDFYIAPCNGSIDKPDRNARCGITNDPADNDFSGEVIKVSGSTLPATFTQPQIGDGYSTLVGVLGYEFGEFAIYPTSISDVNTDFGFCAPKVEGPTDLSAGADELSVAIYNIENFPGDGGAEAEARLEDVAAQIVDKLKSPAIVALQEQQDNNGNTNDAVVAGDEVGQRIADAIVAAGGPTYTWIDIPPVDDQDGGIPGGNIRVSYLYDETRVELADSVEMREGTSTEAVDVIDDNGQPVLSVNPGRVMPTDPAFDNSRKPLAADFILKSTGEHFYLVNVHFASKGGSDPLFGAIQPPENGGEDDRLAQAKIVAAFIRRILCIDPNANAAALGDMNEFRAFPPLEALASEGYVEDLLLKLPQEERYTYIFQGRSQALDHIMVTPALYDGSRVDVLHVNTGLKDQASDHDPTLGILSPGSGTVPDGIDCDFPPPPPPPAPPGPCPTDSGIFINELHYDNEGGDAGEFVEIAGPAGTDVSGYELIGYNGNGGTSYDTQAFASGATLAADPAGAATGYAALAFDGLQNGGPDGVALVDAGGCVLDFISYEGSFTAVGGPADGMTSTDIGVSETGSTPIGASLGRTDDGSGAAAWAVCDTDSRGAANTNCGGGGGSGGGGDPSPPSPGPTGCPDSSPYFINEFHYDNDGADQGEFVEIAGPAGNDVSGYRILGYNGNGGTVYDTETLAGTLGNADGDLGFLAIDFVGLQNGAPDGIALVDASDCVLDFVAYEGSLTATGGPADGTTAADIGVSQGSGTAVGASLGRTDRGTDSPVWEAFGSSTRGAVNAGQAA